MFIGVFLSFFPAEGWFGSLLLPELIQGPTKTPMMTSGTETCFGEFSPCPCLTVLPGPAWVLLNKICKD